MLFSKSQFLVHRESAEEIIHSELLSYGYCRRFNASQRLFFPISSVVMDLVLEFSLLIPTPRLITMSKGVCVISAILGGDGYKVHPVSYFPSVRANIFAPTESGKYYYEFRVVKEDPQNVWRSLAQVGWCDDKCQVGGGNGIGDDRHSWAFDGVRVKKWHRNGEPYGEPWYEGDVVGCGVVVNGDRATFVFFMNGESMGDAFTDCTYSGHLYPACTLKKAGEFYGHIIFGKDKLQFLPEGFDAVYW